MKKAFDQTIRDLKREVNKKVLKVPSIEQKVLDATSNEPWGPHGSLLADIAQASRNYHEYQMIMTIMWKRINSTGKNWRHVYKALTVLEYLVANGSERAIDEIREHAYQISTLSNFQYIDSSGRDQGLNVRRKSQSLVSLVNDKEKIQEVREKAAANRDKFRSASVSGTHEPGSYSGAGYGDRYDDERYAGRYGSRDDDRNGYGREGEWSNRDDDRYGRNADSYNRDADRYGRDSEERYGRGSYRDDDHQGRYADESGSRSSDRDRAIDDEHHSSRGSSVKAEDHPQEGRPLERKFSEQNVGAPPSYEQAIGGSKSPVYSERDGEAPAPPVPKPTSPTTNTNSGQPTADPTSSWFDPNNKDEVVDEFDPRGSVAGTSNYAEVDLIGSLSDSWAITPVSSAMSSTDHNASGTFAESQFMTTSPPPSMNQSFEDPFGDSPFKALSSPDDITTQAQNFPSASSFQPSAVNSVEQTQHVPQMTNNFGDLQAQETFSNLNFSSPDPSSFQLPPNSQPMQQEPLSFQNDDILAGILPPSGPPATSQTPFTPPPYQPTMPIYNGQNFVQESGPPPPGSFPTAAQNQMMPNYQNNMNFLPHSTPAPSMAANTAPQLPVTVPQQTNNLLGDLLPHAGPTISPPSQPTTSTLTTGSLALVSQPVPKKFELKSAVWADTLNRGLVDLNISGPKVNPNAGIGVDFDSLNRKERRMEKPTAAPVASTINMGQAMGSGSGMGRSGAGMIRPQSNPVVGSGMGMGMGGASGGNMGMGMGMGGAPGMGMGMGGYGMMNQRPNMGMGMGQGVPMINQHPGSDMSGGYNNPMMGRGGFPPQQPYGSGYQ